MSTMCPDREHGFAIVSAIFLLVVLAALGGFIATVATTQHIGSALDVMGARAYQSARAGTEWGLFQALKATPTSCVTSPGISFPVAGMTVTVICSSTAAGGTVEAGLPTTIYSITATACNFPAGTTCPGAAATPSYVERSLMVLVEK
jgi:MSHA biogenesis protein MshP